MKKSVPTRLLGVLSAFLLASCTISTPFRGPGYEKIKRTAQEKPGSVVVAVTHAVLRDDGKHSEIFWSHVRHVEETLSKHSGFVGYSRRKQIFGNEAWTLTVWESEKYLNDFVRSEVHQRAISEGMKALQGVRFARMQIQSEDVPPSWQDAIAVLDAQNRR